jgi:recombination protein RecT
MNNNTQLATNTKILELISSNEENFNASLSDKDIVWKKEESFAKQILGKVDKNKLCWAGQIALRNPTSVNNALTNVANIGITLNPALKHAYLLPRGNEIQLDISYRGLMHIAIASGSIVFINAEIVYHNDTFELGAIDEAPVHKRNPFATDRGAIVGAYCVAKTKEGNYITKILQIEEIYKRRDASDSWKNTKAREYSPWAKWENEMILKTVIKYTAKFLPNVDKLDQAIHHLDTNTDEKVVFQEELPKDEEIKIEEDARDKLAVLLCEKNKDVGEFLSWCNAMVQKKSPDREIKGFEDLTDKEVAMFSAKIGGV